jgi:hypothetical protein
MTTANLADGTVLNFPDGTSEEVISRVVKQHVLKNAVSNQGIPTDTGMPEMAYPVQQPTTLGEKAIGAGEAALSAISGATTGTLGGMMNMLTTPSANVSAQREAEFKRLNPNVPYNALEQKFIKGAEQFTYAPRTQTGQEYAANVGDVIERSGVQGLVGMPISGKVVPKIPKQDITRIQNAPKDKLLNTAQKAGYVVLPSDVGAGKVPKTLETLSGKFKSEELFSSKNQNLSNNLTRKYLGLPETSPLNAETLDSLREIQSPAYEAVKNTGIINLGDKNPFANFVGNIQSTKGGTSALLGEVKPNYSINSRDAVEQIKQLRSDGNDYYRSGTNIEKPNPKLKKLGQQYINEANKLEGILENHVNKIGQPELVQNFRNARKEIAKTYSVEKALLGENLIDYRKIGKMIDKKQPITDELALAGRFAKEFPRVNKPIPYEPTAFTLPDVFSSVVGAGVDVLTGVPFASALPAARVGSRYLMEASPFQQRYVKPKYDPLASPYLEQPNFYNQLPYAGLLSTKDQQGQ